VMFKSNTRIHGYLFKRVPVPAGFCLWVTKNPFETGTRRYPWVYPRVTRCQNTLSIDFMIFNTLFSIVIMLQIPAGIPVPAAKVLNSYLYPRVRVQTGFPTDIPAGIPVCTRTRVMPYPINAISPGKYLPR
jgi:hypothetical protein